MLVIDRNPGAFAVSVNCCECGRRLQLANVVANTEGTPFRDYRCVGHYRDGTVVTVRQDQETTEGVIRSGKVSVLLGGVEHLCGVS